MAVLSAITDFADEMTAWRRDLHAYPELGFQEHRTSDVVAQKLESWGIEVTRGVAKTGVVGTLRHGNSARAIGIRADMDALAMEEANDFPHCSRHQGAMHACGHDGHTTMLLGAARYLARSKNFDGTVHFIFQPAEEGLGGGRLMVEEGLFERFPCDAIYGAHNDTHLPIGTIAAVRGPVSAASDRFSIRIRGRGGHAARPHRSIDPVVIGAHVVVALQSIVARRVDPRESAVLSITQFHSGSAGNVIPEEAVLSGTVRTLEPQIQNEVQQMLVAIASTTATAHGAEANVSYSRGYPPVVNAPEPTERAALAAARLLGEDRVVRKRRTGMGGEDFSFMALKVPGCFVRIGQAEPERGRTPVHNPRYDFNDAILPIGASFWATLVEQELPRESAG